MRTAALALAVALDAAYGEPPTRVHPVVWMGRLVDALEARLPAPDAPNALVAGGAAAAGGAALVCALAALVQRLPWPARAVVLWSLLSGRMLLDEVAAVERAQTAGGLDAGRERLSWLVSRDTAGLTSEQVRAAAVQTLAENANDAVVATLFWWSVAGLPGAAVHRWLDTLDSRWGYRTVAWERRGRVAALADDAAAAVPARLTALLWRGRLDDALRTEAARTPSPNGGWPMGAAALATDTRLEKPGAYVLHPTGAEPDATTVGRALRDARRVIVLAVTLAGVFAAVRDASSWAGQAVDE